MTSFWEYIRNGDPIAINILRDGVALIDTGFFEPLQVLLRRGRIRPTQESIWLYFIRAPNTLHNSKWHILQATLDIYWACVDACHAALMKIGETPPTPEHVADLLEDKLVKIYSCGPTVYDFAHIGNFRAYICSDILVRYLEYRGFEVKQIMNLTDVEDKIIKAVQEQNKSLKELTELYTQEFLKDLDRLNILPADIYTKATDYIDEMVKLIEILLEKEFAYKTEDGSIYFNIHKDKEYGKLSHFNLSDLKQNADSRLKKDEYEKENAQDFALWKAWVPEDGEVFWDVSFGKGMPRGEQSEFYGGMPRGSKAILRGRPGWHIECSAMSMKNLGETFDIHTGGVDNIFPHHENEIAQSECATGKTFAKYFIHNEHLLVNGQKMAKSSNNFYVLNDLIKEGIDPIAFRMWLYTSNYSTRTNFTFDTVKGSQKALEKLKKAFIALGEVSGEVDMTYKDRFTQYLDDNLNTAKALALVWELIKDKSVSNENKKATLLDFDMVLGLNL